MEKIVRQSLLYDFYGELLTEHQKSIYEDVVMNDLSYSEIARLNGISRQGVYDMIKRSDKILEDYETKLKLVEKFVNARDKVSLIKDKIELLKKQNNDSNLDGLIKDIDKEAAEILEEF
ncbi:MAG: YlxM family DNA-binding protein [Lachnospiraceae bacterium]|nr:YlxM family DNA-binding protein [Lachnospiraceae bacterium]